MIPSKDELIAVYNHIINLKELLTQEQLYDFAIKAKECEYYYSAYEMMSDLECRAVESGDVSLLRKLAPIMSSLLRNLNKSEGSIVYYQFL